MVIPSLNKVLELYKLGFTNIPNGLRAIQDLAFSCDFLIMDYPQRSKNGTN
jgi:hypothetical protein